MKSETPNTHNFKRLVRGAVGKLVFDDLSAFKKFLYGTGMKSNYATFSCNFTLQEECLNISCPKESNLVGIKRAIWKVKNFLHSIT